MSVFYGFGGFFFGFLVPVTTGLYSCSGKELLLSDFCLRVLFFWLVFNRLVAPFLNVFFQNLSPSFWSLLYTLYPVGLLVPKSNLLNFLDSYLVLFLNLESVNNVKTFLEEVCVMSRRTLYNLYRKLEDVTTF